MTFTDLINNQYITIPFSIWAIIQIWKFIYSLIKNKKVDVKRLIGAGGMPSSHSAIVSSLTTTIAMDYGFASPLFAISLILSLIVMYDAAGVRRAAGKQARILNQMINSKDMPNSVKQEKLIELLGHTPFEVFIGSLVGIVYALLLK